MENPKSGTSDLKSDQTTMDLKKSLEAQPKIESQRRSLGIRTQKDLHVQEGEIKCMRETRSHLENVKNDDLEYLEELLSHSLERYYLFKIMQRSYESLEREMKITRQENEDLKDVIKEGQKNVIKEIKELKNNFACNSLMDVKKNTKNDVKREVKESVNEKINDLGTKNTRPVEDTNEPVSGTSTVEGQGSGGVGGNESYKVAFWNVSGLTNKNENFWNEIKKWDIVIMSETWLITNENGEDKCNINLPPGYTWKKQPATKKPNQKKGRGRGGMLLGVRETIKMTNFDTKEEGLMVVEIELNEEKWRIVGVYVQKTRKKKDLEKKLEKLLILMNEWKKEKEIKTLIGGDFNIRTGKKGGETLRNTQDKKLKIEFDGNKLLKEIKNVGWIIFNGNVEGDKDGKWTFTGGKSVIDYVIGSKETRDKVKEMNVETCMDENVFSDHRPLVVWIKGDKEDIIKNERRTDE
ncbi:PREDICTED: uncharacterized protein LOC105450681 [Wasmannia auropunctata]|uniref:uncharacterized protein LOC105450681 n=1 Tax=Wasmannia auropunctata TaxID=64793 RepID=UPI0005EFD656|nr:PREDICTED: uncharacterized protein LOC105450681 [Wasmannia auropunctata]XP_011688933.1 PREDICTED: uncharacterized protein LOC105450681 [Wasmannia auropunctata]